MLTIHIPSVVVREIDDTDVLVLNEAIQRGLMVFGIRYLRSRYGYDLKGAKDLIDTYRELSHYKAMNGWHPKPASLVEEFRRAAGIGG